jgi:hypothetical protein
MPVSGKEGKCRQMKIFELFGSVLVESDQANTSLDKTDSKAKNVMNSLGKGIVTAGKWGAAFVGATAAAGAAVFGAATKFADMTDNIDKMSQKLGLSREGYQEWDFIMSQSGASLDSMTAGMTKLNTSFDELKQGTGAGADAFARLGIEAEDLKGKTQEEIFETTVTALQGVTDESERAAIATDLLGEGATEMAPLLNAGAGSIEDMKNKAGELGLVMGDDAIDAGIKFTDTVDQLKRSFTAMAGNLMSGLMPTIQNFLDMIMDNMPMIQEIMESVFGALGATIESLLPFLLNLIETVLPVFVEILMTVITTLLPPLLELFGSFVTTILPPLLDLFMNLITLILPPLVEIFSILITSVLPPLMEIFILLIDTVLPPFLEILQILIDTIMPPLMELFTIFVEVVLPPLMELFTMFIEIILPPLMDLLVAITTQILPPFMALFGDLAVDILPTLMEVFRALLPVVEFIMYAIADVIGIVTALISGDWEAVWEGIKSFFTNIFGAISEYVSVWGETFGGIFQSIADVVSGIWDGMVSGIKTGINTVIGGLNSFIEGINSIEIPDWVPAVGGLSFNIPTIPLLERGADIISSGRVRVGEHGPEDLILPAGARVEPLDYAGRSGEDKPPANITQNVYITATTPLSPSEVAKQTRRASRKLAVAFA